jgi:hypothetical protein
LASAKSYRPSKLEHDEEIVIEKVKNSTSPFTAKMYHKGQGSGLRFHEPKLSSSFEPVGSALFYLIPRFSETEHKKSIIVQKLKFPPIFHSNIFWPT